MTKRSEIGEEALAPLSIGNRLAARLAALGPAPKSLVGSAEPLWSGDAARARRLAAGVLLFGGSMVEAAGKSPWDITPPTAAFSDALHGFDWLDDLAAAAEPETEAVLRNWAHDWVARFGRGQGPGWCPALTGRRLLRWACHAMTVLNGADARQSSAFFRALGQQARFLRRRWRYAPAGLPRFEAAAGLIYAGIALEGAGGATIRSGVDALARTCSDSIAEDGGIASRNPEHLGAIFSLLVWARRSLDEVGMGVSPVQDAAMARLAAAIRTLRHDEGTLARFHGGSGGEAERLDRALTLSLCRAGPRAESVMGLHRLASGRTVVFIDGGPPSPDGATRAVLKTRHASSLCLEVSSARMPMIVSVGPGTRFGPRWSLAARATAAHSGATLAEASSARVSTAGILPSGAPKTSMTRSVDEEGARLTGEHDGWLTSHGLLYQRRLSLSADGSTLKGEDRLLAEGAGRRGLFDKARAAGAEDGVPLTIRFHLHPDVVAETFLAGSAIHLRLGGGVNWVMRQSGGICAIEDSVYLDQRRLSPRATKQIVVRAHATDYRTVVKWSFRRAGPERLVGAVVRG